MIVPNVHTHIVIQAFAPELRRIIDIPVIGWDIDEDRERAIPIPLFQPPGEYVLSVGDLPQAQPGFSVQQDDSLVDHWAPSTRGRNGHGRG
jgi:hypothetical protein